VGERQGGRPFKYIRINSSRARIILMNNNHFWSYVADIVFLCVVGDQ
jgi:hypothetical protein